MWACNQSNFSAAFQQFIGATHSKWLTQSLKFLLPSNFSGSRGNVLSSPRRVITTCHDANHCILSMGSNCKKANNLRGYRTSPLWAPLRVFTVQQIFCFLLFIKRWPENIGISANWWATLNRFPSKHTVNYPVNYAIVTLYLKYKVTTILLNKCTTTDSVQPQETLFYL